MDETLSKRPTPGPTIRVRPAREADLEAVGKILAEGFHSKFAAAFGERVDRAARIITRTLALEAPYGLPGLFVAEVEGAVAGTIALRRHNDPNLGEWESLGILLAELGLWGGIRAMVHFSLLDQSVGRDEVYVSDVAVSPPWRRRGVGRALLAQAEQTARAWGKRALALDVSARNTAALQLYRQLGYGEHHRRHPLLTRWLLGEPEWVRMRKELA